MQSDISMKFKFLQKKGKAVDNSVTSSVCSQWTISANKSTCHASRQSKFDLRSPQQKEKIKSPLISAYAPRHVHTLYLPPHTCHKCTSHAHTSHFITYLYIHAYSYIHYSHKHTSHAHTSYKLSYTCTYMRIHTHINSYEYYIVTNTSHTYTHLTCTHTYHTHILKNFLNVLKTLNVQPAICNLIKTQAPQDKQIK